MPCTGSGAKYRLMRESEAYSSQSRSALARCAVALSAQGVGLSATGRPMAARMWAAAAARAASSGNRLRSAKQVIPARSISATPRRVPSRTKSALRQRCSTGPMISLSQRQRGPRTGKPRSSVCQACVWAFTRPGSSACRSRTTRSPVSKRSRSCAAGPTATMRPAVTATACWASAVLAGAIGSSQRASISRSARSSMDIVSPGASFASISVRGRA